MITRIKYNQVSGIYLITNKISNKKYVGQASSIYNRWINHRHNLSGAPKLRNAVTHHGWENFSFDIIEECAKDTLDEREEFWIKFYDTTNPEIGYNILESRKNITITRQTRLKMNKTRKEHYPKGINSMLGKKHSEETKELMSSQRNGIPKSEQHAKNIAKALSEKSKNDPKWFAEQIEKRKLGQQNSKKIFKPVMASNEKETLHFVSLAEAIRKFNFNPRTLSRAIKKNKLLGGYYWSFKV